MLNVIMLNVTMLSVMAPRGGRWARGSFGSNFASITLFHENCQNDPPPVVM